MTCFSNAEEGPEGVNLAGKVPLLPESQLTDQEGAKYSCGKAWKSNVCVGAIEGGGKIVTGQNPQSSEDCAKKMLELIGV